MNAKTNTNKRRVGWIVFASLFVLSFFALQQLGNYSFVRITISNSQSGYLKIYWTTVNDPVWSESKSAGITKLGRTRLDVFPMHVPSAEITNIRLDPATRSGIRSELGELSIHNLNSPTITLNKQSDFQKFSANKDVGDLRIGNTVKLKSIGRDPWLMMKLPPSETHPEPALRLAQAMIAALLLLGVIKSLPWLLRDFRWVVAGLFLALTGVVSMATLSKYNSHPDEITHINNAEYYVNHYIPPESCTAETLYTYTVYGVSRLDNREIAYYLGGRYLQLVDAVPAASYHKLRYFNVALFFIIVLLAYKHVSARILFLPLLLTPQAWYLFSYYNSDALSLFAVVIAAYQVLMPHSMLRRLINGERPPGYFVWIGLIAIIVALQFWVKLNYIFYPMFLVMLAVSWGLVYRRMPSFKTSTPVIVALVLGIGLFSTWEISRHAVNDFSLSEKSYACREKTAGVLYKPSTPLNKTHPNFNLRGKGYSIIDMVTKRNWSERIFYTGIGAYGYTEYLNSYAHYAALSALIVLIFVYASGTILIAGGAMARMSVLSMLAAMIGITLAAMINNWDQDYQPQGRYLMVYFPLFGSILAMYARKLNLTVVSALGLLAFILAAYSFFGVGLIEIPKS